MRSSYYLGNQSFEVREEHLPEIGLLCDLLMRLRTKRHTLPELQEEVRSVIGTLGGGIVGSTQLGVDFRQYMSSALSIAETKDLFVGLFKAGIFGMVIGTISVSQGFSTTLGATGVGRSTQRSVIVNFLLILMLGYMVTRVFYR